MNPIILASLENLRNRMVDLLNGDRYVDLGTLLYILNRDIGELGGERLELKKH